MKRYIVILPALALLALLASPAWAQNKIMKEQGTEGGFNAAAGFEKLKSLAGDWQGSGPHGTTKITYQPVSGGSAVQETLMPPGEPSMITMYHLDGEKLVMSHYCSIGNQPRMQAQGPAGEITSLTFALEAVTNLAEPTQGHMVRLAFTFQGHDQFTQVWTWRQDGSDTPAIFTMARTK